MGFRFKVMESLILANALLFFLALIAPAFTYRQLALTPATVLWKPWTLLTSMFIHAGFNHILFNMIALFFFGMYLERLVGEEEFFKVYFGGGLVASLAYVFTSLFLGIPAPIVPAVGASGAVFAVMGTLVVLRPNTRILIYFLFPLPLYVFALLYGLFALSSMFSTMGSVAHNAHLGGLIAGLAYGYYLKKRQPKVEYVTTTYGYRFGY